MMSCDVWEKCVCVCVCASLVSLDLTLGAQICREWLSDFSEATRAARGWQTIFWGKSNTSCQQQIRCDEKWNFTPYLALSLHSQGKTHIHNHKRLNHCGPLLKRKGGRKNVCQVWTKIILQVQERKIGDLAHAKVFWCLLQILFIKKNQKNTR